MSIKTLIYVYHTIIWLWNDWDTVFRLDDPFLYLHENTPIKSGGNGDDWRILNYMLILAVLLFRFFLFMLNDLTRIQLQKNWKKNCTCFWKGWIRSSTPVIDVCSIYDWLPDVTTSPTGTSNVLAMNPKTLNTTNPAKKLVPQFITLTMIASL